MVTTEQQWTGAARDGDSGRETKRSLIDCDIHNVVPSAQALFPYLPAHWREHITNTLFKGPAESSYPRRAPTTERPGSAHQQGPAGSDLGLLREQVLDALGVE